MDKVYDASIEQKWYKIWEESGYFHDEPDESKQPFCIVMPPPNITGQLHLGHALDNMVQDALTRFKRMQGYCVLWLPGTDHASIATEVKIVETMATEGLTKKDVGREGFLERAWEWKKQYGGRIVQQLRRLGSSCDWRRERFTMDEGCSEAVLEVFVRLYEKGLIYRGDRIINWCPDCRTALSDAEVEYQEQDGHFWHIQYPLTDGTGHITVATTRPETMLGDTAVAVHPEDERYKHLIGRTVTLPLMNREIPIIADEYVDRELGSGAVKMTPAHDPNDFEVGQRHDLEIIRVMDDGGVINEYGGKYNGMERYEARKAVVKDLESLGLLERVETRAHNIGECYRCSTAVEPIISKQWFVDMKPLAKPAIEAVRDGRTKFVPDRFSKIYFNWMENIRDWCISRQLWWGHRIPAYYCDACGEMIVAKESPKDCAKCGSTSFRQDEDVLDTWFSSGLWPFSTMGWPKKTKDLAYFYPTDVLVTAYEIIFFWVARMIVFGLEFMGDVPFKTVSIHGIVRDELGRKMSKSLGNGIDPLELIDKYGADALRFSLANGVSAGNDMRLNLEKVESARNFANKIWNASRFVLMNADEECTYTIDSKGLDVADKWILTRFNEVTKEATHAMEAYELGLAGSKVYDFAWSELCDWYIEIVKPRLRDEAQKACAMAVLLYVLKGILKLLHPFMPFITEEIYSNLPGCEGSIMRAAWPQEVAEYNFSNEASDMQKIIESVRAVRNMRAQMNVPPSIRTELHILSDDSLFGRVSAYFEKLAFANAVIVLRDKAEIPQNAVPVITSDAEIFIPIAQLVDVAKERERLGKEKAKAEGEIARLSVKLNNQGFVSKAPQSVVDEERNKLTKARDMAEKISERLKMLENV